VEARVNRVVGYVLAGCALLAVDGALVAVRRPWEQRHGAALREPEAAVARFLDATSALRASGADPRAADRLPATPDLASEILAGKAFAARRLAVEERDQLVRLERTGSRWVPNGAAEVYTREFWVFREAAAPGVEAAPPVSAVWNVRYEVVQEGGAWRVADFRMDDGPRSTAEDE
jgi:hypothetical protein